MKHLMEFKAAIHGRQKRIDRLKDLKSDIYFSIDDYSEALKQTDRAQRLIERLTLQIKHLENQMNWTFGGQS